MRYSGSRFVRETSAMVSEKDEAYHGPGKALRGWKNWVYTIRKARAASTTMGTRAPSCERDSSESSMARWASSHRQQRRALEKARQIWGAWGNRHYPSTPLETWCLSHHTSSSHMWAALVQDSKHPVDLLQPSQSWVTSAPLRAWVWSLASAGLLLCPQ